jgi:hypothetical protein
MAHRARSAIRSTPATPIKPFPRRASEFIVNDIGAGAITLRQNYNFIAANVLRLGWACL